MGDCDFNAGVIDSWYRQTYKERQQTLKKDKVYQQQMQEIRKIHICHVCQKYPGDEEYTFGMWINNRYKCFDCI